MKHFMGRRVRDDAFIERQSRTCKLGGGGGGGSGETRYNWNDVLAPKWGWVTDAALQLNDRPFQQYEGERIADLTGDQTTGMDVIRNTALRGSALGNAGRNTAMDTVQGKYLTDGINPYAMNLTDTGQNQFLGKSPAFQNVVRQGMNDITDKFQQGAQADANRMFAQGGAYGGSAHLQQLANNQRELGKTLGNYSNQMENAQYDRSANLDEARLNRAVQASEFDKSQAIGAYENERQRMQGAIPYAYQGDEAAYGAGRNLLGIGDAQRQLGQDRLNLDYQDFQDRLNYPQRQLDWSSGILSRAQGGMSPNMTTTQNGYSASPFSQFLGTAMGLRGMFGG